MGTTDRGFYLPAVAETGWSALVNANFSRAADVAYNVKAYGAAVNGTTNDLAAINSAVAAASAAGGGTVLFPGLCGVRGPVVVPSNVTLAGIGPVRSGLKAIATWSGTAVISCGSGVSYVTIRDMTVDGNSLAATGIELGAGGSAAGHNFIERVQVKTCTSIGIDAGETVGGSECHVFRCDITGCPTAILSGQDNQIIANNMGSFTTYGIDLQGGGNTVIGNHPVSNSSGTAVCLRVRTGSVNVIEANYFDSGSASLAGPMLTIAPGAGNTIRGAIIRNNVFLAPTISVDATYPAILLDMTTGTISNTQIMGNSGVGQNTTHRWSAVIEGVNTPGDTVFQPGNFYFCAEPYTGFTPAMLEPGLVYDGTVTQPSNSRHRYIDKTISGAGTTTLNAHYGPDYLISVTTASAFTIATTNQATGLTLNVTIKNDSGGSLGTITWTNFLFAGAAQPTWPANTKRLTVSFVSDGTNWYERWRGSTYV